MKVCPTVSDSVYFKAQLNCIDSVLCDIYFDLIDVCQICRTNVGERKLDEVFKSFRHRPVFWRKREKRTIGVGKKSELFQLGSTP